MGIVNINVSFDMCKYPLVYCISKIYLRKNMLRTYAIETDYLTINYLCTYVTYYELK